MVVVCCVLCVLGCLCLVVLYLLVFVDRCLLLGLLCVDWRLLFVGCCLLFVV